MNTQSSPARRPAAALWRRAVSRHVLAGALAAAAFPVLAQDAGQWQRLERMEGTAAAMGGPVQVAELSSSLAADFEVRLQRLERMIAEVNGRNEELTYQVTQLKDRLERINSDIDFRLNSLESGKGGGGLSAVAPGAPADKPASTAKADAGKADAGKADTAKADTAKADTKPGPVALPAGTPEKQYEYAFTFLRNQEYDKAEKALQEFIAKNKANDLAGNAQFWLGEAYYVQKKYTEAAVAYAEGMQKYPKNAKAADNLLKLGMALGQLNKKTEACTAFGQLNKKFPTAAASIKRRVEAEQRRLNCPL